jgi:hypothetical protein
LATIALLACAGDDGGSGGDDGLMTDDTDAGTGARGCIDEDDDGFGRRCTPGLDCDDEDPSVTDECRRCVEPFDPKRSYENCPCDPGTEMLHCIPDTTMRVTRDGVMGTLVCSEGARYCRDGAWTDCEFLAQYTSFVPD